jgi:hypothetical protein
MPNLYEQLPKLEYNGVSISDITVNFRLTKLTDNLSNYYTDVDIPEGSTPENVSLDVYGTTDYWWLILIANDVIDPFYDWLMRESEVEAYANKLYDNVNDIHHWEDVEYNEYDENNVDETLTPVTNMEWEIYKNDKKRRISIINPNEIHNVEKELKAQVDLMKLNNR